MNEALLIFLSLTCFTAADYYLRRPGVLPLAVLVVASTGLAVIKLPYAIAWAGILGLFLERYGRSTLRQPALWTVAVVNIAAAALWYSHAHQLATSTGLSFGMTDKLFDVATVFSVEFPKRLVVRLAKDILGPVLLIAVGVGCWVAFQQRRRFETLGVAGYAAYLVIVARGNFQHDYYQLVLMPIAPVLASVGVIRIVDRLASRKWREEWLAVLLGVAIVCTFVRHVSAHSWYEYSWEDVALCEVVRKLSAPNDRLVFVAYRDPNLLFCADRKGWLLPARDSTGLTTAISQGARLAIVSRAADESVREALRRRASRPVYATSDFDVFSLPQSRRSASAPSLVLQP